MAIVLSWARLGLARVQDGWLAGWLKESKGRAKLLSIWLAWLSSSVELERLAPVGR